MTRRRVAIDARGYFTGGGIGRYTRCLVHQLAARRPAGLALQLLISGQHRPTDLDLPSTDGIEVVVSRAGWMVAGEEERWLPVETEGADLVHSLTGHWLPERGASVATLHDLIPVVRPRLVSLEARRVGRQIAAALPRASHVIAVSHATAQEARRVLGPRLPPTSVVYEAAAPVFHSDTPVASALWHHRLPTRGYILAVSALNPHKNLARLVAAYSEARVAAPLLIVGALREATADVERTIAHHQLIGRVRLMGRVTDEELAALYANCHLFVYPSLHEGFGLPLVEAMACGAPVIASRSSSIPEVAGGAALLVDPRRTASLASALRRVDHDPVLRQDLRLRARARARSFSWTRAADATLAVYARELEARAA
ncbi:MAG: glycosyltransferase family 4 protein [Acidobacteria bacterium]|nr:glycosyltransferase family 4 protein [Acidobacteriota bacterium]